LLVSGTPEDSYGIAAYASIDFSTSLADAVNSGCGLEATWAADRGPTVISGATEAVAVAIGPGYTVGGAGAEAASTAAESAVAPTVVALSVAALAASAALATAGSTTGAALAAGSAAAALAAGSAAAATGAGFSADFVSSALVGAASFEAFLWCFL